MAYFRCPKCWEMSTGKKCKYCKISVVCASYFYYIMRVVATY